MRATLEGDSPPSTNSTARHRRRCSSLAVPIGLVILHYTDVQTPGQALPTLDSVASAAGRYWIATRPPSRRSPSPHPRSAPTAAGQPPGGASAGTFCLPFALPLPALPA